MTRSRRIRVALLLIAAVVLIAASYPIWFRWMGEFLVESDPPMKADAAIVLAGDWTGDRILKAAEMVEKGYAPVVFVSGPTQLYGVNEATLAINYAVSQGKRRDIFVPMTSNALSTRDEVNFFGPELRRRGIHKLLIVSSDFHTRRAGKLFRKGLGSDFDVRMIVAPDRNFSPDGWWKNREGQKVFFFEWSKTIATVLGI